MGGNELLVERDREHDLLRRAVADISSAGDGSLLLVQGEAGIGKTALLSTAASVAADAGMAVHTALGASLERDFGYGIVRQLFERHVRALPEAARDRLLSGSAAPARAVFDTATPPRSDADAVAVRHALFWLVASLAERRPVALVVDDAHWADAPSLRWTSHVARRLTGVPVLIVIAVRSGETTAEDAALDDLRDQPLTQRLTLSPLTASGISVLTRSVLGVRPEAGFAETCRASTGGNPLYVKELLRAAAEAGVAPTQDAAAQLGELGGRRLGERVLRRLASMAPAARSLAEAVAVLGSGEVYVAGALAGLSAGDVAAAADDLTAAGLLVPDRPLRFAHDVLRVAVSSELAPGRRSEAHKRAAVLLARDPERQDEAALHLLHAEPAGDAWTVECLRRAADSAVQRAAPEQAVSLLRRALREPAGHGRPAVLAALGHAERLAGHQEAAIGPLLEAAGTVTGKQRESVRRELAYALMMEGRAREATAVIEEALQEAAREYDVGARLRLTADLGIVAVADGAAVTRALALVRQAAEEAGSDAAAHARTLAILGYLTYWTAGGDAADAVGLVERALRSGLLVTGGPELFVHVWPVLVLWHADRIDRAHEVLTEVLAQASRRGALSTVAAAEHTMSRLLTATGDLEQAELLARGVLRQDKAMLYRFGYPAAVGALMTTLVARGRLDEAQALLSGHDPGPDVAPVASFHIGRIALRTAQRRHEEAAADAEALLHRLQVRGHAGLRLSEVAADALLSAGQVERAVQVAREGLTHAERWGTPGAIAPLCRVLGAATGDEPQLRRAVALLEPTPLALEKTRALLALGAHLRRNRRAAAARDPLRRALDLAQRMDAQPLMTAAEAELRACGGRPRRAALFGADSLTATELRVATLAAEGLSNRRIATALFVSPATVETHLRSVFRKLSISSRTQIASTLEATKSTQGPMMRPQPTTSTLLATDGGGTP